MTGSVTSALVRRPTALRSRQAPLFCLSLLLAFVHAIPMQAQEGQEKRPLPIADHQLWRSISGATISPGGSWVAWEFSRVRGDDTLHVVNIDTDAEHVVPLASGARFSDDGVWVAYFLSLPFAEAEGNRRGGDPVSRKAELLNLASGEKRSWDDVASFGFAKGSSHFFVSKGPPAGGGGRSGGGRAGGGGASEGSQGDQPQGADLILRNLTAEYDELIGSVAEFGFNKAGTQLAYTVDAADQDGNGLYLVNLETGARKALDNAKERYSNLTWAEEGNGLAVLRGEKPEKKTERVNTLLAFTSMGSGGPTSHMFRPGQGVGLPDGWVLSEKGSLTWSDDLNIVFIGLKAQEDEFEDWPEDGLPLADVDIWHWADDRIQPVQMRQVSRDRNRTYLAAVNLDEAQLVPLADEKMQTVEVTGDGRWAMGRDESEFISDWKPRVANYYRIDTRTGERHQVLRAHERTFGFSPDGKHYLYWLDGHFFAYRPDNDIHVNLTASNPVGFANLEYDHPGKNLPTGSQVGPAMVGRFFSTSDTMYGFSLWTGVGLRTSRRVEATGMRSGSDMCRPIPTKSPSTSRIRCSFRLTGSGPRRLGSSRYGTVSSTNWLGRIDGSVASERPKTPSGISLRRRPSRSSPTCGLALGIFQTGNG